MPAPRVMRAPMTKGGSTRSLPRPAPLGTRGSGLIREAAPGRMAVQTRIPLQRGTGPRPRTRSALTARRNGMQRRSRGRPPTDPPKPMPPRPRKIAAARSPSFRQMAWALRTRRARRCPKSGPPGPRPRRAGPSRPRPHSPSGARPKKTAQALRPHPRPHRSAMVPPVPAGWCRVAAKSPPRGRTMSLRPPVAVPIPQRRSGSPPPSARPARHRAPPVGHRLPSPVPARLNQARHHRRDASPHLPQRQTRPRAPPRRPGPRNRHEGSPG